MNDSEVQDVIDQVFEAMCDNTGERSHAALVAAHDALGTMREKNRLLTSAVVEWHVAGKMGFSDRFHDPKRYFASRAALTKIATESFGDVPTEKTQEV